MYETFSHTADLGLRVKANSLENLLEEAGKGLMSIFVDRPEEVRPLKEEQISIEGTESDYLFFDWLTELLFRFETQQMLYCEFEIVLTEEGIAARVVGEECEALRHQPSHEVKAITYHQLKTERTKDGWLGEVIVDI